METNVMKSATLKDAFKGGIVNNISAVRANDENGYLFVTVLNRAGAAHNVYFGKKSAEQVEEGDILTKDQMLNAEFVLANNEAGEARIKISLAGANDYTNLANIFDDVEVPVEHTTEVLTALKKAMLTREQSEALAAAEEEEDDDAEAIAAAKAIRDAKKAKTGK